MNAHIRLERPPPYHAQSKVSVTEKCDTFHHYEYETSHISRVWINIRSKHMQYKQHAYLGHVLLDSFCLHILDYQIVP